jgi:hypothetical protein
MADARKRFNCQYIEIDIEKTDKTQEVVFYENRKIDHLIVHSNHKIERIDLFSANGKMIKSHCFLEELAAVNLPAQDEALYLMVVYFSGTLLTHTLLIV